ncbi:HAD-IIB family hydrolase [Chloroflexota bacterium]
MTLSYRHIDPGTASRLRLVMTDVDGTLTPGPGLSPGVPEAVRCLEETGIMVGLVSGRTIAGLEDLASNLGITGPVIAENGGVARLKSPGELVDLGYSRWPAVEALERLKRLSPGTIVEREDNKDRFVDIVFRSLEASPEDLEIHLQDVELLDSGYILHLMQKGISKGQTLKILLPRIGDGTLSDAEVMVIGDSPTDLSLFEMFPNSVLVLNPRLSSRQREMMCDTAAYSSEQPFGEGFAEVALHIVNVRQSQA